MESKPSGPEQTSSPIPVCVDMDGTFLQTDTLVEQCVVYLKEKPTRVFDLISWLSKGRAHLKARLARAVHLNFESLPYNSGLLAFLQKQVELGRPVYLTTAADELVAREIADRFNLFSGVIASDGTHNLKGKEKADRLCRQFGERGFDYAGNSKADIEVWNRARHALVVGPSQHLASRVSQNVPVTYCETDRKNYLPALWQALRPHQWVKNLLVFVPLLVGHKLGDVGLLLNAFLAFITFSICASSVYLLNDLLDLQSDRQHPQKRHRPCASGELPLAVALAAVPLLLCAAMLLAWSVGWPLFGVMTAYYGLTLAYSYRLKSIVLIDVFALAILYTLRLFAGSAVTGVALSPWLLAFSIFIFLSLALAKRCSELYGVRRERQESPAGRGYHQADLEYLSSLGASSGYLSVLVLALYINSPEVKILYQAPFVLWGICLLLLYWISRFWFITHRGGMHEDPIVFALKDRASHWIGLLIAGIMLLARHFAW